MQTQTDALNIASDLRNDITGAQNAYNQLVAEIEKEKVSPKAPINTAAHQCASNAAKQLSGFLAKLSAEFNLTKLKGVFPSGTISSLHNYIKTIKDNGQASGKGFVSTMSGMYWNVFNSHGVVPPQFTQITNAFNDLNQSVSGISSSIQAQMQYLNQNLQQFFGIYKSFFDDYSQLSSYIVNRTAQS
jgi:phage-related protein